MTTMSVPPVITITGPTALLVTRMLGENVITPARPQNIVPVSDLAAAGPSLVEAVAELTSTVLKPLEIVAPNVVAAREPIRGERSTAGIWIDDAGTEFRRSRRTHCAAGRKPLTRINHPIAAEAARR